MGDKVYTPAPVVHAHEDMVMPNANGALTAPVPVVIGEAGRDTPYKAIDLFAGIGGIRMGFEEAFAGELSVGFVSEWDPNAQKTYKANFHTPYVVNDEGEKETVVAGDITAIKENQIPSFDICLAGFPCQAFSIGGLHQGFDDDYHGMCRGTLFLDVARICDYHKPRVIFCENVKGLLIHNHGETFQVIKQTFEKLGYKVFWKILNSKDFGVAQNRERIYIVCFRSDIAPEDFAFPNGAGEKKVLRDILEKDAVSAKYYLGTTYLETLRNHKARHAAKGHGFGYQVRGMDDIAGTLVCGGMGRERNLIIDQRLTDFTPVTRIKGEVNREGIRKLTPREWARLQGFPDDFRIDGMADSHLYRQFGNTVTVPVIREIAKEIRRVLQEAEKRDGHAR